MAELEDSVEDLQLEQVNEALKLQPEEAALQKLKSDLEEVISLTRDLISFQTQAQLETQKADAESSDVREPERADAAPEATVERPPEAEEARASAATLSTLSSRVLPQAEEDAEHPRNDTAAPRFTHSSSGGSSVVGRTCLAEFEGKKFYAEILDLKKSKQGERVVVEFIGWKNQQEYPIHQVQLLAPVVPSALPPGTEAQAIFSEDGKWYDCVVDEHTSGGYKVTYTEYGNSEEVKFDQAQRNSKKRRVKAIKLQQQIEMAEKAAEERAKSWQKFNKRALNKRMAGYMSGRGHESMFSGHEVKTTVSISVLNSRKTTVNSFVPRRKHDVDEELITDD
ncbi:malic enzyme [Cystoisospora suis]|uniref:Malic enzyme n=1 Tax=Cystoisospora suis TaxID=483139 RepID=A0A2C6L4S3_9APIC|nr:malic enzyme [Cystoisospora suis]